MAAPTRTIGLFGSSLNPPTYLGGHFSIVQHFSKIFSEVWVLPVYKHTYPSKQDLLPFPLRCELATMTFKELPNVHVKTYEKDGYDRYLKQPSESRGKDYGTVDLLHYLTETFPDKTFAWILGADNFNDILAGKWDRGHEILKLPRVEVALVQREGTAIHPEATNGCAVKLYCDVPVEGVSSTKVRACADPECLARFVHPDVAAKIQELKLYGFSKDSAGRIS